MRLVHAYLERRRLLRMMQLLAATSRALTRPVIVR